MKLHQKGFLLVQLSECDAMWDYELVAKALAEYKVSGLHWISTIRVALEELASAGLVTAITDLSSNTGHQPS